MHIIAKRQLGKGGIIGDGLTRDKGIRRKGLRDAGLGRELIALTHGSDDGTDRHFTRVCRICKTVDEGTSIILGRTDGTLDVPDMFVCCNNVE